MNYLYQTDDVKTKEVKELLPPITHLYNLPVPKAVLGLVHRARHKVISLIHGRDNRLLAIIGPCSIHNPEAALGCAEKLLPLRKKYEQGLSIAMCIYSEGPRMTVGWKGLTNNPHINDTFDINPGLYQAGKLLLTLNDVGMSTPTRFLNTITPQYYADLISQGAIGA